LINQSTDSTYPRRTKFRGGKNRFLKRSESKQTQHKIVYIP